MVTYDNKIQDAIASVEENKTDLIVLSTGVVLKPKKFSFMRLQTILTKFKYPEVPVEWDKERGREIKNPESPSYLEKKAEVDQERSMAVLDAIIAFGTEIHHIPAEFEGPEGNGWIEELELIEIPVRKEHVLARYQAWVKYVAAPDPSDIVKISEQFGVQMGTAEVKVAENIRENFPD